MPQTMSLMSSENWRTTPFYIKRSEIKIRHRTRIWNWIEFCETENSAHVVFEIVICKFLNGFLELDINQIGWNVIVHSF